MPQSSQAGFSFKRSLGISSALHLLLAPLFVVAAHIYLGTSVAPTPNPTERVAVTSLTLERRPRAAAIQAHSPGAPQVPRIASKAPQQRRPAELAVTRTVRRAAALAPAKAVAARRPGRAHMQVASVLAAPAATAPAATAAPAPSAEPTVADHAATVAMAPAQVRIVDVPPGGWGQNFEKPIVADDGAVGDLRSKYHLASAVTVEVDESGRAVKVVLPASASSDLRAEIERRLLELRYIPAECNGLRCSGTLQIEL
jgi:hypothetical protein